MLPPVDYTNSYPGLSSQNNGEDIREATVLGAEMSFRAVVTTSNATLNAPLGSEVPSALRISRFPIADRRSVVTFTLKK